MELRDPFSKAATVPPQGAKVIRALVPTGRHVGHGQDLKVVHGPRSPKSGTLLERYTGKKTKQVVQPVGKGIARGLAQTGMYKPTSVPKAQRMAARIPKGTLAGRQDAARRQKSIGMLFQNGSSSGRRIG